MDKKCFHCGLDVPENIHLPIIYKGQEEDTCCAGCQAVATSILDAGLEAYYLQRTADATKVDLPLEDVLAQLKLYDLDEVQKEFVHMSPDNKREAVLMLSGITCAACVWLIEQQLLRVSGVVQVDLNYSTQRARVTWDNQQVQLSDILLRIQQTGYQAHPFDTSRYEEQAQKESKKSLNRLWVAGLSMMQVMMYAVPTYLYGDIEEPYLTLLHVTSMVLTLPVMLYSAIPFYRGFARDLKNKRMGMDTPVTIAIVLAFIASCYALGVGEVKDIYFDSISMFVFLLLGGRYLEQVARRKAGDATDRLIKLVPAFCHVMPNYPQSTEVQEGVVAKLSVDDVILIKPGEVVPVDGVVIAGHSEVNEAMLTGESMPNAKHAGDTVVAGTMNMTSALTVQTSAVGVNTRLSSIVRLLDNALAQKPKVAVLADKYASWFIMALLVFAVLIFGLWWYIADAEQALWVVVSLLVITCPCALSLATPAALAAATGNLAERGILISKGHTLETLSHVTDVVFDKTGTLTYGEPSVTKWQNLGAEQDETLLLIAQALEAHSEHPIAKAICVIETEKNTAVFNISNLINTIGQGISAQVNGKVWSIGRMQYVASIAGVLAPEDKVDLTQSASLIALGDEHNIQALFYLQDGVKPEAKEMIQTLKEQGLNVHLLSGDYQKAVQALADDLNITSVFSQVTPEEKLTTVQQMQQAGKVVMMVGDGINDVPVLAQSNVSLAMGSGADVAREGSDMVMLKPSLALIPQALNLARRTRMIIQENLWWALCYNVIALPIAAMGLVTPWIAALGMACSSLLVVMNALRLLQRKKSTLYS